MPRSVVSSIRLSTTLTTATRPNSDGTSRRVSTSSDTSARPLVRANVTIDQAMPDFTDGPSEPSSTGGSLTSASLIAGSPYPTLAQSRPHGPIVGRLFSSLKGASPILSGFWRPANARAHRTRLRTMASRPELSRLDASADGAPGPRRARNPRRAQGADDGSADLAAELAEIGLSPKAAWYSSAVLYGGGGVLVTALYAVVPRRLPAACSTSAASRCDRRALLPRRTASTRLQPSARADDTRASDSRIRDLRDAVLITHAKCSPLR